MEEIKLGTIINVRGLKGEVKIDSCTSFGSIRYKKGNKIIVRNNSNSLVLTVLKFSHVAQFDYVMFEEIDSIEKANELRGFEVFITKDQLHKLDNNSYYYCDLKDCIVYDELNNELGVVSEVIDNPGNTIIRVKNSEKEFLVPFVKQFIISVDISSKKIVIRLMEGLV